MSTTARIAMKPVLGAAAALLLLLGGCTLDRDPIDRPGTWQPTGVNDHNLRAMIATPSHLERGVGSGTERAQAGTLAATRLFTDRRRSLPVTSASAVGAAQQQQGDAPVTGPGAGNGGGGAAR